MRFVGPWQNWALGSVAVGLALSPLGAGANRAVGTETMLVLAGTGIAALLFTRPRRGSRPARAACLVAASLAVGMVAGNHRIESIDSGASALPAGELVSIEGEVAANPTRSKGITRIPLQAEGGKLMIETGEAHLDLIVGSRLRASGEIAVPDGPYADYLRRKGMSRVLRVEEVSVPHPPAGAGESDPLDVMRRRSSASIGAGVPEREGNLARSLVLGQQHLLDPGLRESFRRSGLSHLLAVSGQNVLLLLIIAAVPLAAIGVPLAWRIPALVAVVAVYVPLAGGDPSIQRAGIMGVASLLALSAGRPPLRSFGLLCALSGTLLANPRATGDPGWQLSFVAVLGIFAMAGPLRRECARVLGRGQLRDPLAEGAAVTIAATAVTLPLITAHFEEISLVTVAANVLVLPAVAPAMWLGMTSMALGMIPGLPTEPVNLLNLIPLGYLIWLSEWISAPSWAAVEADPWTGLAISALCAAAIGLVRATRPPRRAVIVAAVVVCIGVPIAGGAIASTVGVRSAPDGGRITALDVGQGDAILVQDAVGGALMFDAGPPDAGIARSLRRAGVDKLSAVVITHDDLDHSGGLEEVLTTIDVGRLLHGARPGAGTQRTALRHGVPLRQVLEGDVIRFGKTRISVLWPSDSAADESEANEGSIVAHLKRGEFDALLTGDAEHEMTPIDAGPVELLKVAHHGSADDGLDALLARSRPALAWISVGEDNRHGHPHSSTIEALDEAGAAVERTDLDGDLVLDIR